MEKVIKGAILDLFPFTKKATDGSFIPENILDEYLQSDDYKELVKFKDRVGGETHKDRRVREDLKTLIGADDELLLNDNAIWFITGIKKGTNGYAEASVEFFDEDKMDDHTAAKIRKIKGMLSAGVRPPISSVIKAYWDTKNVCQKLNKIKGVDITLNPGFEGTRIKEIIEEEKTYSQVTYSEPNNLIKVNKQLCVLEERTFSSNRPIRVLEDDSNSTDQGKGLINLLTANDNLKSFRVYKELTHQQYEILSRKDTETGFFTRLATESENELSHKVEELERIGFTEQVESREIRKIRLQSEFSNIKEMDEILSDLKKVHATSKKLASANLEGVPLEAKYLYRDIEAMINKIIDKTLETRNNSELIKTSTYSLASIKEELLLMEQSTIIQFSTILNDYKKYFKANEKTITDIKRRNLENTLLSKITSILTSQHEVIKSGGNLVTILGLTKFNSSIVKSAQILTPLIRKMMILEETTERVDSILQKLNAAYNQFFNDIKDYVFGRVKVDTLTNIKRN